MKPFDHRGPKLSWWLPAAGWPQLAAYPQSPFSGPDWKSGRPEDPPGFIGNGASHQSKSDSTSSVSTLS